VAEIPLESTRPPVGYEGFRAQPTACGATQPPELTTQAFTSPDDEAIDSDTRPVATIVTSCGEVVVELDPSVAPETVNSFVFLAESGYFDGTAMHRVVPGFVVQAGDPIASGTGGPGYAIPDEFAPADFVYTRGTVAMANGGPGTSGSQFFMMLDDVQFPPQFRFNVFGIVVEGFDTLARIAALPLGASVTGEVSVPLESVYVERITVSR
jgi:peptidyl-prolyl cis-trans isomerase B (cyclophilin B)